MRLINLFIIATLLSCTSRNGHQISIKVDVSSPLYTMKGGMGASWHAISKEFPLNNEKYITPVREVCPRGSAYGGNPPVDNTKAWEQIKDHASWLGMNFIRVELSQRMYEPERRLFDWENEEMLALYHILDWAQENNADIFLQQMFINVEWNSIPGIHPLISAPNNLDDYAHGVATMLEYLTLERGYTCLKYFCMTNEPPGGTWGYWWDNGDTQNTTNAAWKRLKQEFDLRNISIPISGPDWTDMPPFNADQLEFAESMGAIDIHSYHGVTPEGEANLKKWADWSHERGKPFFLTEYGNMNLGWGEDNPAPKSFDAAISNACDVIRGLRAGVDGFNRWSFTNRGDLDGQWQLIKTFDIETKEYLSDIHPEPEAYYGFGIISRFLSKYSTVVSCEKNLPDSVLMSAALLSSSGELSIVMVNLANETIAVELEISSFSGGRIQIYRVSREIVNLPEFKLNAISDFESGDKVDLTLPARSITNATSYILQDSEKGIF